MCIVLKLPKGKLCLDNITNSQRLGINLTCYLQCRFYVYLFSYVYKIIKQYLGIHLSFTIKGEKFL